MTSTPRLALPFLIPGQAQKEATINEALQRIDALAQTAVEEESLDAPPSAPRVGQCYIVGRAPSGEWLGKADALAIWSEGGWRFVEPFTGLAAYVRSSGQVARYEDGEWQYGVVAASEIRLNGDAILSSRRPAIPDPQGGAVIDLESRAALASILAALRHHGLIAN